MTYHLGFLIFVTFIYIAVSHNIIHSNAHFYDKIESVAFLSLMYLLSFAGFNAMYMYVFNVN